MNEQNIMILPEASHFVATPLPNNIWPYSVCVWVAKETVNRHGASVKELYYGNAVQWDGNEAEEQTLAKMAYKPAETSLALPKLTFVLQTPWSQVVFL